MSDVAIRVENLGKRYRIGAQQARYKTLRESLVEGVKAMRPGAKNDPESSIWALKDVSFEVKQGEAIGVIGRNGAGKSTLLKILAHITRPTTGQVEIHGRVGSLLEVGTGFHPELTGRDNIYLNGAILGMKRAEIERKFDEIVAFAEIEKFLDTPAKHYSSGMYMRLAFAVAAHLEPEILLVDEVLAVGDAAFQKKCLGKMGEVAGEGRTVLFVSHNMAAITQLCDNTLWINNGKIVEIADSGIVVAKYLKVNQTQVGIREWKNLNEAPGDDKVRLISGEIIQNGITTSIVDINQPFNIRMKFNVLKHSHKLISAVNLFNSEGSCLFNHADWKGDNLDPGYYEKSVTIPSQTLAEGPISILLQLVFYEPSIQSVVVPDVLIIEAVDSNSPNSVRGPYKGKWPGLVRIGLIWTEVKKL